MAAKYPSFPSAQPPPKNPSELWYSLTKDAKFGEHPRHYQMAALEKFHETRTKHPDIAICLPTGTGKTAVGLLAGRFDQAQRPQRVLYLTPNKQLADQVLVEAVSLGIASVDLRGTWKDLPLEDRNSYAAGTAIGVASYHTLFNSRPQVAAPDLLILDDVHAAGEAALNPWQVQLTRVRQPGLFEVARTALRPYVSNEQFTLTGDDRPPDQRGTQLVPHRDWLLACDGLRRRIRQYLSRSGLEKDESDMKYPWESLDAILEKSFCFLSRNSVTIRPWVPPSMEVAPFRNARVRLYLSATIDQWGHLQQVMGVETVERIGDLSVPIQGQRLIVDTSITMAKVTQDDVLSRLALSTKKALVLVRSEEERQHVAELITKSGYDGEVLGHLPELDIDAFRTKKKAMLVLANRYDGIDLGHGVCKHIVIVGLPSAIGVREQFLGDELDTVSASAARARQRLQQAMGRCTRTEKDTAVVWLVGERLSEFIHDHNVRAAFPPRLRLELAQVDGLGEWKNVVALAKDCLARTDSWTAYYRTLESAAATQAEAAQLNADLIRQQSLEARFSQKLVRGLYDDAAAAATATADKLDKAFPESAAFWYYMAAVARDTESFLRTNNPFSSSGDVALTKAQQRAKARWFEHVLRQPPDGLPASIEGRVRNLKDFLAASQTKSQVEKVRSELQSSADPAVRRRLNFIGQALGFQLASMPTKDGQPDSVWILNGEAQWIWEAKTDKTNPVLGYEDARQVICQPDWVQQHAGVKVSDGCRSICLSTSEALAHAAAQTAEKFSLARPARLNAVAVELADLVERLATALPDNEARCRAILAANLRAAGDDGAQLETHFEVVPATSLPVGK